jgi:hypothetical protein
MKGVQREKVAKSIVLNAILLSGTKEVFYYANRILGHKLIFSSLPIVLKTTLHLQQIRPSSNKNTDIS